jgi:hypothetical protein
MEFALGEPSRRAHDGGPRPPLARCHSGKLMPYRNQGKETTETSGSGLATCSRLSLGADPAYLGPSSRPDCAGADPPTLGCLAAPSCPGSRSHPLRVGQPFPRCRWQPAPVCPGLANRCGAACDQ